MNSATSKLPQFTSIYTTRRTVDSPLCINEMALQFEAAPFLLWPVISSDGPWFVILRYFTAQS
jgi:hypothetical protein